VMADVRGWPDPAHPGIPPDPDQERPHLIADEDGKQFWLLWEPVTATWASGPRRCSPSFAGEHWTYIGAPPRLMEKPGAT
jgi:hypothetical protein